MKDKLDILIEKIAEQGTDEIQAAFIDFQAAQIQEREAVIKELIKLIKKK